VSGSAESRTTLDPERVASVLAAAVERARVVSEGSPAAYIPELANVDLEQTSAAVTLTDGVRVEAGDATRHRFTLQSSAKLVLLAGLLEELGEARVFAKVGAEPSGASFSSLARLEIQDPHPANPLINAGAIALCSVIPGAPEAKLAWIGRWAERLYGEPVAINTRVLDSERKTGDRNRSIAFFLKSSGTLGSEVNERSKPTSRSARSRRESAPPRVWPRCWPAPAWSRGAAGARSRRARRARWCR
jgi:glutaminase